MTTKVRDGQEPKFRPPHPLPRRDFVNVGRVFESTCGEQLAVRRKLQCIDGAAIASGYTAVVGGKNNTTGIGLVEAFKVK